jgi:DNA (cytosine-5)-methyltransferase 1
MRRYNSVSLFSGAMGLDLGLERAGFDVRFAADNFVAAVATIRKNRPSLPVFEDDIRKLTAERIYDSTGLIPGEVDLLSGGPPCQSFSTAGRRLCVEDNENGPLIYQFTRLIDELRPRAFLMENVKGILSAPIEWWMKLPEGNNGKRIPGLHGTLLDELLKQQRELGYTVDYCLLNSADYGVPQVRWRVFFVGFRDGEKPQFPLPSHSELPGLFTQRWKTIREAMTIENDHSHRNNFSPRKLRYLRLVPPGGNWRSLPVELQQESMGKAYYAKGGRSGWWRRLSLDAPSPTILTEPQQAGTSLCHPTSDRPLTVRECARIQTFPDDWEFCGRGAEQYRMVGNSVPVLLGEAVGRSILGTLTKEEKYQTMS